jgi:hypothetical protein
LIERLLDDWLIRANERSFQIPFCHSLAYEGHTVVHLSRHCAMEMGKDILTIAKDGVPCAYQLKGVDGSGKLSLRAYREDLERQLHSLVLGEVVHPSIPSGQPHRAYIVINGELEEEVSRAIDDFNRTLATSGMDRRVNVILRGELFRRFKELQSDFWATNLGDVKTYLELYLEDGRGQLPKEKIASLFENALPFKGKDDKAPSQNEVTKAAAGCAIICASSISSFTNAGNHLAEFEAWTMYLGYILSITERWNLPQAPLQFAIDVAFEAMYSALARLCDELMERQDYSEGNVLSDRPLYEVRMTHLLGLMGIYGLWRSHRVRSRLEQDDENRARFLRQFSQERSKLLSLWGEYAVPQFLAHNFFRRTFDHGPATDIFYCRLIEAILTLNGEGGNGLANPYYDPERHFTGLFKVDRDSSQESFYGSSFYLEGLLDLFVRTNFKQTLRGIFPSIMKVGFRHYIPSEPWRYYLYRNRCGKNHHWYMQPPHKWGELKMRAAENDGDELPKLIKQYPIGFLCFLCVYPHRVNASGLRWLSSRLLEVS